MRAAGEKESGAQSARARQPRMAGGKQFYEAVGDHGPFFNSGVAFYGCMETARNDTVTVCSVVLYP